MVLNQGLRVALRCYVRGPHGNLEKSYLYKHFVREKLQIKSEPATATYCTYSRILLPVYLAQLYLPVG